MPLTGGVPKGAGLPTAYAAKAGPLAITKRMAAALCPQMRRLDRLARPGGQAGQRACLHQRARWPWITL